jgi:HAD domain in Swiss Army Knife RNA repair proteins
MQMNILFLDFDGVINSDAWYEERPFEGMHFDPNAIRRVEKICRLAGAQVVVSSTWRLLANRPNIRMASVEYVRGCLDAYGFCCNIIDVTPPYAEAGSERGHEIQQWLNEQPAVTSFAILDDTEDMVHLSHRFVKTDYQIGITDVDVEKCITLLRTPLSQDKKKPRCPDCGGDLGGEQLGRLEKHEANCPRFPL